MIGSQDVVGTRPVEVFVGQMLLHNLRFIPSPERRRNVSN